MTRDDQIALVPAEAVLFAWASSRLTEWPAPAGALASALFLAWLAYLIFLIAHPEP